MAKKNEFVSVAMCIVLVVLLTVSSGVFWTTGNFDSLQAGISPIAIISFGMMLLIICGYFDLSVSSVMLLAGVLAGQLTLMGVPIGLTIFYVLLTGLAAGSLNGFLVSILGINPLIATIGTQYIGYGLAMTIWNSARALTKFPAAFIQIGEGKFLGLYYMTWIMLALLAFFIFFLRFTFKGRQLYFIGGNKEASKLVGIKDRRALFAAYAATGLLAALAGVLAVARIQTPSQHMGSGVQMTCLIACVVGGGSFAGGKGTAVGALFGVVFMTLLTNMFTLLEMNVQLQNVVVGLILIAVIVLDGYLNIKKMREIGKI